MQHDKNFWLRQLVPILILAIVFTPLMTLLPARAAIQIEPVFQEQPPGVPVVGDFSYSQIYEITNDSGAEVTDPIVRIPVIPYSPISMGSWAVTLGDQGEQTYNVAIPFTITEHSGSNLTDYPVKIILDSEWLTSTGMSWSTEDGNETVWVADADFDSSIPYADLLKFWIQEGEYDWDNPDTVMWVAGNMTAWGSDTWYMLVDADLTTVVGNYTNTKQCITETDLNTLFDFFDPMDDADNWDTDLGTPAFADGICTIRNGANPEQITSKTSYGEDHALVMRVNTANADGNSDYEGSQFGFGNDDRTTDVVFLNLGVNSLDEAIECDDAATTYVDDNWPFPEEEYAIWEIIRRGNGTANKSRFARFLVNNIQLQETDSYNNPIQTNVPDDNLEVLLWSDDENLLIDWVLVRDSVSPEPLAQSPFLHHDPDTIFLNENTLHWPYDVFLGNLTDLWNYCVDEVTRSSEYATEFYTVYPGTLADGASGNVTVYYGNDDITSASTYWDCSSTWDYWDDFNAGDDDGWTDDGVGTWGTSDQARPTIFDYSLMPLDDDYSAIWVDTQPMTRDDGTEVFMAFVGSWEGYSTNYWQIPWKHTLYERMGDSWYPQKNVLAAEQDEMNHASAICYWWWEGDGSYLGNSSWWYMIVDSSTMTTGDFDTFIYYSDDEGDSWRPLNNGAPVANFACVDDGADRGRFTQLIYYNGDYYMPYGQQHVGWEMGYVYSGNSTHRDSIKDMLYDDGTITPATVWADGGTIIDPAGDGIETGWFYDKDGNGDWIIYYEEIVGREFAYSDLTGTFDTTMDSTDWAASADMQDFNTTYQAYYGDIATLICDTDSNIGIFNGKPMTNTMQLTKYLGEANSTSFDGDDWDIHNIDKERVQSNGANGIYESYVTGANHTAGTIIAEATVASASDDATWAGIAWRVQDDENYYTWFIDAQNDGFSYGKYSNNNWSRIDTYDPGEDIWPGEAYRLKVEFDGNATDLYYSKIGWDWVLAFEDLELTDDNIPEYGSIGMMSYEEGFWDDFRYSENIVSEFSAEGYGGSVGVDTTAATNITGATATLNGDITSTGSGVASIAVVWSTGAITTDSGSPEDWDDSGTKWHWTETENSPYAIDSYSHNISGLESGTTYYCKFLAQSSSWPNTWVWGDQETFDTPGGGTNPNIWMGPDGMI